MRRGLSVLKYPVSSLRCLSRADGETLIHMYSTVQYYIRTLAHFPEIPLPPSLLSRLLNPDSNYLVIKLPYAIVISCLTIPVLGAKRRERTPTLALPLPMTRRVSFQKFRESGVGVNVSVGLVQLAGRGCAHCRFGAKWGCSVTVFGESGVEAELKVFERGDDGDEEDCFGKLRGKRVANLQFSSLRISTEAQKDSYLQQRLSSPARVEPRRSLIQCSVTFTVLVYEQASSTKYSGQQGMPNVKQIKQTRGIESHDNSGEGA
jgi:hypothetical protein